MDGLQRQSSIFEWDYTVSIRSMTSDGLPLVGFGRSLAVARVYLVENLLTLEGYDPKEVFDHRDQFGVLDSMVDAVYNEIRMERVTVERKNIRIKFDAIMKSNIKSKKR